MRSFHQVLEAHHAYIQRFFDDGSILASGPMEGGRGGIILLRLEDGESVEQFCANDPFAQAKIQSYKVTPFDLYQIQPYAEQWR